jgi:Domain of unknown function (DUF4350)
MIAGSTLGPAAARGERSKRVPRRPAMLARVRDTPSWILLCVGMVGLFLALGLLGDALGGEPGGPVSSSYATNAQGLAAWAELLSRDGHSVRQLRTPLEKARLDPADTVVILDPEALLHSEGQRLLAFVRAGGRLVIGGGEPQGTLLALFASPPTWGPTAPRREIARTSAGTTAGVGEVISAGEGAWSSTPGYNAPFGGADGSELLLERNLGRGRLELLADASPLQNRLLSSADNAQLALNLSGAGARPVVFVESVHGFGESRGLAALPSRWRLAFAALALAGLLWIVARGRRLGPAEQTGAARPPPRSAYAEAISLLLRRAGDPHELDAELTRLRDGR